MSSAGSLLQLVDDAAEQHGLALARVALDPEQAAVGIVAPLAEIVVVKDPAVRIPQQAALGLFDACFIIAGIGRV